MKNLFQATFEQSLKLNDDNRLMECMEKSSKRSIWYRLLGPWTQCGVILFLYFLLLFAVYNKIPKLYLTTILLWYTIFYGIIYLLIQIIICRKQIIISDCLYKITAGQFMILFSLMTLISSISYFYKLHLPILLSIFCVVIFLFSFIYFIKKIYNSTFKILYDQESENKMKWFDRFYRWIMKYGGILVIITMILKWLFGKNFDNLEGWICTLLMPFASVLCLNMGIHYLFEVVNAYYLVKYSEEYRENYGFTITEWYGKYSKRAMRERRMQKKN